MADGGEDALRAVSEAVRERWRGGRPQGSVGVQPDHGHVDREVGLAVGTAGAASLAASRHLCGRPLKAATGNDKNPPKLKSKTEALHDDNFQIAKPHLRKTTELPRQRGVFWICQVFVQIPGYANVGRRQMRDRCKDTWTHGKKSCRLITRLSMKDGA